MRFLHTADWHLGRYFHGLHLTDEQRYLIFNELLPLIKAEKIETVVIAGDIYDRAVPPVEAVALFDEVLTKLIEQKIKVIYIAGNHDSAKRLQFGSSLLERSGVFVQGEIAKKPHSIALDDKFGSIYFSLFPYAEPLAVRQALGESSNLDFNAANEILVRQARESLPAKARTVAIAHAFIAGGSESSSERVITVGGSGNVSAKIFADYSYTALGHLHNPQRAGGENIRYSGSLMKYSFDEAEQSKGVNIVDISADGSSQVNFIRLTPRRDVVRLKGTFAEMKKNTSDDFIEIVLTDNGPILDGFARLRENYPNLLHLRRESYVKKVSEPLVHGKMVQKSELELFEQYYERQLNTTMTNEEKALITACINEIEQEERTK